MKRVAGPILAAYSAGATQQCREDGESMATVSGLTDPETEPQTYRTISNQPHPITLCLNLIKAEITSNNKAKTQQRKFGYTWQTILS